MNAYLRKGVESKAMSVDSDQDGGYLVTLKCLLKS